MITKIVINLQSALHLGNTTADFEELRKSIERIGVGDASVRAGRQTDKDQRIALSSVRIKCAWRVKL